MVIDELVRSYSRNPDTLKIWQLSKDGLSARQISKKLGFKFGKVNSALRRGRESGVIPRPTTKPISNGSQHKNYLKFGSISMVLDALTNQQIEWLATQTRQLGCETVAEFIVEVVRDTHANEELTNE